MRRREKSFGRMPGESKDAGDQQEQKEEASRALAHHQEKMQAAARERRRRRGNVGESGRQEDKRRDERSRGTHKGGRVEGEVHPHC